MSKYHYTAEKLKLDTKSCLQAPSHDVPLGRDAKLLQHLLTLRCYHQIAGFSTQCRMKRRIFYTDMEPTGKDLRADEQKLHASLDPGIVRALQEKNLYLLDKKSTELDGLVSDLHAHWRTFARISERFTCSIGENKDKRRSPIFSQDARSFKHAKVSHCKSTLPAKYCASPNWSLSNNDL